MTISIFFHALTIISTGLFSGLMMTLAFIMQKQWSAMNRSMYFLDFPGFLKAAKGNPLVSILTLFSFLVPLPLGILSILGNERFLGVLLVSAGLIFLVGCFLVTMRLNFPIYNKATAWNSENEAADWENTRRKFYMLNIIRFCSSALSLVILVFSVFFY